MFPLISMNENHCNVCMAEPSPCIFCSLRRYCSRRSLHTMQRSVWDFTSSSSSPPSLPKNAPPPKPPKKRPLQLIVARTPSSSSDKESQQLQYTSAKKKHNQIRELPTQKHHSKANQDSEEQDEDLAFLLDRKPVKRTLQSLPFDRNQDFSRIFDELWNDRC